MKTLRVLLVAVPASGRDSLLESLTASGYLFDISEAADKRQALLACSRLKFDVLIVDQHLPDGHPEDLTNVLDGSMACLVLRGNNAAENWNEILEQTLDDWKDKVEGKTRRHSESQQLHHTTALERCRQELKNISGGGIDRALKVILEVMEVSRVYIRETQTGTTAVTHEIAAPGHLPISGSRRSAYEVSVQCADGRVFHLGIEDVTHHRQWSQFDTDFISAMAHLLKDRLECGPGVSGSGVGIRLSA